MDLKANTVNSVGSSTCHLNDMETLQGPGLSKKTKTIMFIILIYAVAFFLATA